MSPGWEENGSLLLVCVLTSAVLQVNVGGATRAAGGGSGGGGAAAPAGGAAAEEKPAEKVRAEFRVTTLLTILHSYFCKDT